MIHDGPNHEGLGHLQATRGLGEQEGERHDAILLFAGQLKLMLRRSMRLMLVVVVLVIFPILVTSVVVGHMCAGD
ncbi:MAG: hypothetical protein KJ070_15710 [Verrucomicrobia bacterium]|nr:hypothetical protein [Verrucomicrobiota bacterium]